jgi:large subunit ribosomal protein L18
MQSKKNSRLRRARKLRARILAQGKHRLCVYRTPKHIYAQIIGPGGDEVLTAASTLSLTNKADLKYTGNTEAAIAVGGAIAKQALDVGIDTVAFDRSGFAYHGRVKALAEAAREGGLKF